MANEPETETEPINDDILTRDGALYMLREIRKDIRLMQDQDVTFKLSPRDGQIQYLKTTMDALGGQIYALSIMLAVALEDADLPQELMANDGD